jgi:6-phosphofructokinase 1
MSRAIKRIGVLTGGGDAPGLNAVIRAVVRTAHSAGIACVGLEDSFDGLVYPEKTRPLLLEDVRGIHRLGGTILGTTNRGNPFAYPQANGEPPVDYSERCAQNFRSLGLDALVVIGGDGTLAIAHELQQRGVPSVGVPKTIDNDIAGTTMTFGFDSAVAFATLAIDRLHTSAHAHHRIMVVEVMGRYTGWIALHSGIAGGADVTLIPEIPFDLEKIAAHVLQREGFGARFSVVVAAEGAYPVGGERSVRMPGRPDMVERLGGIGARVATELESMTGKEARSTVLGHLQRGGMPTSYDRLLATRFGSYAVHALQRGETNVMVALDTPDRIITVPLDEVVHQVRTVPLDSDLIQTARSLGMVLGD